MEIKRRLAGRVQGLSLFFPATPGPEMQFVLQGLTRLQYMTSCTMRHKLFIVALVAFWVMRTHHAQYDGYSGNKPGAESIRECTDFHLGQQASDWELRPL